MQWTGAARRNHSEVPRVVASLQCRFLHGMLNVLLNQLDDASGTVLNTDAERSGDMLLNRCASFL